MIEPDCQYGYTDSQLHTILGDRVEEFAHWMWGQTMTVCEAAPERKWADDPCSPGGMRLVEVGPPLCSDPHGPVVYPWDLQRFLEGGPIVD